MNRLEFKNGDLVYHKTNIDVTMIIQDFCQNDKVLCSWITKKGIPESCDFHSFELDHIENLTKA